MLLDRSGPSHTHRCRKYNTSLIVLKLHILQHQCMCINSISLWAESHSYTHVQRVDCVHNYSTACCLLEITPAQPEGIIIVVVMLSLRTVSVIVWHCQRNKRHFAVVWKWSYLQGKKESALSLHEIDLTFCNMWQKETSIPLRAVTLKQVLKQTAFLDPDWFVEEWWYHFYLSTFNVNINIYISHQFQACIMCSFQSLC